MLAVLSLLCPLDLSPFAHGPSHGGNEFPQEAVEQDHVVGVVHPMVLLGFLRCPKVAFHDDLVRHPLRIIFAGVLLPFFNQTLPPEFELSDLSNLVLHERVAAAGGELPHDLAALPVAVPGPERAPKKDEREGQKHRRQTGTRCFCHLIRDDVADHASSEKASESPDERTHKRPENSEHLIVDA